MVHFSIEGPFLYMSTFGRTVNSSVGPFAEFCGRIPNSRFPDHRNSSFGLNLTGKEYAAADFRWGKADSAVVSFTILSVFVAGPMCCYILKQIVSDDPARHYWIVVLSTAELYGGWMTFCPEWLTGSPNLDTSNALFLWVYLFVCTFSPFLRAPPIHLTVAVYEYDVGPSFP
jgi:hypothetical protein